MDLAAMNWAVLELTGSALLLGLINACRLVPVFAISLPAGVLADRLDRRRLLIAVTAGTMVLTFLVGALVAAHAPFWIFAVAVAVRASLAATVPPVRSALVPNLVPPEAMAGAVASQAMGMNLARIIGPAVAGTMMGFLPVRDVFWINGASFLAVLWTLWVVRPEPAPGVESRSADRPRAPVSEAWSYIRSDSAVQSLLILATVPMIFGYPYTTLLPLFSQERLDLGPEGFGALLSVSAVGALSGSGWLALRGRSLGSGRRLVVSILVFGAGLLWFTACRSFASAAAAMFLVGLASQFYRTASRISLQHRVPDPLRGRILSIALMDRGLIPLGSVLLGALADRLGAVAAGSAMGGGCILVTLLVLAFRRSILDLD